MTDKRLNIFLWITQWILAMVFILAGWMKISTPIDELAINLLWVKQTPELLVRFIGYAEYLGGLGLILPSLLKIKPILTPWAAISLSLVMFLALIFHLYLGEYNAIAINIIFGGLALFIYWGRTKKLAIIAR
jgi:putative oxidoreductase